MGKVNNALRMLAILRSRKKVTRRELAEELEVTVREITRYKDDLEYAGVNIITTAGKYGGYELQGNDYLLNLDLSNNEIIALDSTLETLKSSGSHLYYDLRNIKDKIYASISEEKEHNNEEYSISVTIKSNYEEERNKWLTINESLLSLRKLLITYIDSNGKESERIIRPLGLYTYYGANFCVAFCEDKKALRNFKIIRIKDITKLKDTFHRGDFNLKEYLDNKIGLNGEETYKIKLKINYPYAKAFTEFKWLNDEVIEDFIDDGFIIYSAKAKGKTDLINWILGMGSNCSVLEPASLKEDIINEYKKCIEKYELG